MAIKLNKRFFFISLLLVVVACISAGFYLFNKGPKDVKHSTGIPVKAADLYSIYVNDSSSARNKFTGRILEVSGEVAEVSLNTQQQRVVVIKTPIALAYINCTLEDTTKNIKPLDKIVIKGICSGMGQGDADLGIMGDVYLTRCFLAP